MKGKSMYFHVKIENTFSDEFTVLQTFFNFLFKTKSLGFMTKTILGRKNEILKYLPHAF